MLDGAAKVEPLFAEAQRLGMPAVGMTDHGNMYGASEFYNAAKKSGIKPIIGIEAYIAPASRFDTKRVLWGDPQPEERRRLRQRSVHPHDDGRRERHRPAQPVQAVVAGLVRGPARQVARMDDELIAEHAEGIIATTGCPSGEVQTRLRLGHEREALEAAAKWREIFGPENFFLELMDHGLDIERRVREGLLEIGRKLDIPPLATNDCHYVTKDAAQNHEALLCIQTGKTLSDPTRFKFDGDGYYLKSAAEMRALWDDQVPGACDSTLLIAERVQSYDEVWQPRDRMPVFPVPEGETQDTWLRKEVERRPGAPVPRRHGARRTTSTAPTSRSTSSARRASPAYFLVVADLINHARAVGIRVGPGRGSAAGSLVAYALGITNIDPIPHGLLFERFLNPERVSMPDIDIDFDDRRRGEMVRYATEQVGQRPGRPGHHLRHHQDQGGDQGLGAGPVRPARLRHRRPDHQGAAAADHGQGHPAVRHHRPDPRAVQGGRRGPRR